MKHLHILLLLSYMIFGCGLIGNLTDASFHERPEALKPFGLKPRHADMLPMGGLMHDAAHVALLVSQPINWKEVKEWAIQTNVLFVPSLAFLLGVGVIEIGITAGGDVVTLPVTTFHTIFFKK